MAERKSGPDKMQEFEQRLDRIETAIAAQSNRSSAIMDNVINLTGKDIEQKKVLNNLSERMDRIEETQRITREALLSIFGFLAAQMENNVFSAEQMDLVKEALSKLKPSTGQNSPDQSQGPRRG